MAPSHFYIEESPTYIHVVRPFFEALDRGEFAVVTSVITLLEVLVHPLRHGDKELAGHYRGILLGAEGLRMIRLSADLSEQAAQIRADHGVRTPDAIQLATACHEGATFYLTNDTRLPSIPGLTMLMLDELKAKT